MKKLVYLISPNKIHDSFYNDLRKVLAVKNTKFFQLRLKKIKKNKIIKIAKEIKKITRKYKVKLIINDHINISKITNADGCHLGQSDSSVINARKHLKKNVPSEVTGIAFLSGGQSEIEASKNLNEINKINDTNFLITFSYGRGLQASALKAFGKDQNNQNNIQKAFDHRAKMNGLSSKGEWSENLEKEAAA